MKSMRLNKRGQKGFTLIELMIVVAIVGILAAIALPAYNNYMVKSKLTEATAQLDADRAALSEVYANSGTLSFPTNPPIATVPASNAKYVTGVAYNQSASNVSVILTLGATGATAIDGKYLGLFGTGKADGTVAWQCATATGPTAQSASTPNATQTAMFPYLPAACQN